MEFKYFVYFTSNEERIGVYASNPTQAAILAAAQRINEGLDTHIFQIDMVNGEGQQQFACKGGRVTLICD